VPSESRPELRRIAHLRRHHKRVNVEVGDVDLWSEHQHEGADAEGELVLLGLQVLGRVRIEREELLQFKRDRRLRAADRADGDERADRRDRTPPPPLRAPRRRRRRAALALLLLEEGNDESLE